jgi:fungal STAND N-terminal Goodbye domain
MQASCLGGYFPSISHNNRDAMSISPSPELKSLLEDALNEFENRAGTNLIQHQIIDRLKDCESPDSVINVLREQAQAFRNFRGEDGKLMVWLKRTVNVLHTLSTSDVLSEGIGLVRVDSIN